MEINQGNNLNNKNPCQNNLLDRKRILLDNLSIFNKIENIFIIDFFHICSEKDVKTHIDIIKFYDIVKEFSVYDENVLYLFLHSNKQMELIEDTKALNNFSANNIFIEDKIANVSLISGFCIAKNISVFIFTDGINQLGSWTKTKDPSYEKSIKISELDYFRITLDYMLKDKRRKYEQEITKTNKNKLLKLIDDSNKFINTQTLNNQSNKDIQIRPTLKNILSQQPPYANFNKNSNKEKNDFINKKRNITNASNSNPISNNNAKIIKENSANKINEKERKNEIEEHLGYKFINFLTKITKYIQTNPPRNFEVLKNIINHFTEQNIISINNNLKETSTSNSNESIQPEELSFYIFKELIKKEFILSKKLYDLVNSNIVSNLDEISNLLNFQINLNNNTNKPLEEEIKNFRDNNQKLIQVNSNANADKNKFSIGKNSEEDYKNLILNCYSVCLFVKNGICKILNTINLSSLEKLPTNPARYKNYIFSFVNNQELYKLSKNILNLDYNNIVNIITDGIILEFMRNNLIVFITDKKINYNLPEIEKEKFRLFKTKNPDNIKNEEKENQEKILYL
jgi:hypothetical protein